MIDFTNDLGELLKEAGGDKSMQDQYELSVKQVKEAIKELTDAGISLADLHAKFGSSILKAQLLKANKDIAEDQKTNGESHMFDAVNEDELLARMNQDDAIQGRVDLINELKRQGYRIGEMRQEDINRLLDRFGQLGRAGQGQPRAQQAFRAAAGMANNRPGGPPGGGGPPGLGGVPPGLGPAPQGAQPAQPMGQAQPAQQQQQQQQQQAQPQGRRQVLRNIRRGGMPVGFGAAAQAARAQMQANVQQPAQNAPINQPNGQGF